MTHVITAIDTPDLEQARALVAQLQGVTLFKFGLEFAEAHGPDGLMALDLPPYSVFLDHKWFDISNTMTKAALAVVKQFKPAIVNVHAMSGVTAMMETMTAVLEVAPQTKVVAVTVLTSWDDATLQETLATTLNTADMAVHLATLAQKAGLDGVVCSGHEIADIKHRHGDGFLTVVPGIRLPQGNVHDQKRVMTPRGAAQAGADYLVIGRPITQADNPAQVARGIVDSLT